MGICSALQHDVQDQPQSECSSLATYCAQHSRWGSPFFFTPNAACPCIWCAVATTTDVTALQRATSIYLLKHSHLPCFLLDRASCLTVARYLTALGAGCTLDMPDLARFVVSFEYDVFFLEPWAEHLNIYQDTPKHQTLLDMCLLVTSVPNSEVWEHVLIKEFFTTQLNRFLDVCILLALFFPKEIAQTMSDFLGKDNWQEHIMLPFLLTRVQKTLALFSR